MNIVMPGRLVIEMMLPEVADALYEVCQEFDCDLRWSRDSRSQPGTYEEFCAEPLFPDRVIPYGLRAHVSTNAWYGEYQWQRVMRGARFERGKPEGYVKFNANLHARMGIPKGCPVEPAGGAAKGFLCWASEYQLADGTTCFRLNTNAGILWVRGAEQNAPRKQMLQTGLTREDGELVPKGSTVVQLAEYSFCYTIGEQFSRECTPLDWMTSVDSGGRQWHIVKDRLSLDCSLRLDVVGRYNDRLRDRTRRKLHLPYETVWELSTGDDQKIFVPLDY